MQKLTGKSLIIHTCFHGGCVCFSLSFIFFFFLKCLLGISLWSVCPLWNACLACHSTKEQNHPVPEWKELSITFFFWRMELSITCHLTISPNIDRQGQKFFIQAKRERIWEHHFWRSLLTRESTYTCMKSFLTMHHEFIPWILVKSDHSLGMY